MQEHELKAIIRAKNEAWAALAQAERYCLSWQREHVTDQGLPRLPAAWDDRRAELATAYKGARQRYVRAMLQRRNGR